jgi:2-methylaconitate cis-trans-isomerase PrpF
LSLNISGTILPDEAEAHPTLLSTLDKIRRQASVLMGLSSTPENAPSSIPKVAMVSAPISHKILSGEELDASKVDLVVRAISVGQPHRAVPITVAMAIAAAGNIKGSVVNDCLSESRVDSDGITLGHSSGKLMVGAEFDDDGLLLNATVFRTARRLMEGTVYWK